MKIEIKQYKKKPLVVEAVRLPVHIKLSKEVEAWSDCKCQPYDSFMDQVFNYRVETLEGVMEGTPGDYLIKGIKGEFYIHAGDFFDEVYDEVIVYNKDNAGRRAIEGGL